MVHRCGPILRRRPAGCRRPPPKALACSIATPSGRSSLAELERHVRVGVERVGEGDTVVAVRDIPVRYENR